MPIKGNIINTIYIFKMYYKFPHSLGKEMFKVNNGRNLVLEIKLFKPRYIILFSKFFNKNKNKRLYYGLVR